MVVNGITAWQTGVSYIAVKVILSGRLIRKQQSTLYWAKHSIIGKVVLDLCIGDWQYITLLGLSAMLCGSGVIILFTMPFAIIYCYILSYSMMNKVSINEYIY